MSVGVAITSVSACPVGLVSCLSGHFIICQSGDLNPPTWLGIQVQTCGPWIDCWMAA